MSDSFATPWTVACQTPLSRGFPREEHWSGLPFLPLGDLPTQGLNPGLLRCRQILYHWATLEAPPCDYIKVIYLWQECHKSIAVSSSSWSHMILVCSSWWYLFRSPCQDVVWFPHHSRGHKNAQLRFLDGRSLTEDHPAYCVQNLFAWRPHWLIWPMSEHSNVHKAGSFLLDWQPCDGVPSAWLNSS